MVLKEDLPPMVRDHCIKVLDKTLRDILTVGEVTKIDRKKDKSYANIIIEMKTLISQLKNADSN